MPKLAGNAKVTIQGIPIIRLVGKLELVTAIYFFSSPLSVNLQDTKLLESASTNLSTPSVTGHRSPKDITTELVYQGAITSYDKMKQVELMTSVTSIRGAFLEASLYLGQSISGKTMIRALGTVLLSGPARLACMKPSLDSAKAGLQN